MISIDNFEHIRLAYGGAVAERAASLVRVTVGRWLGDEADLSLAEGGVIHGRLTSGETGAQAPGDEAGRSGPVLRDRSADLFGGLPPMLLAGRDYALCLVLSVARVPDFSSGLRAGDDDAAARDPFFGQAAGRGKAWIQRYRADMTTASGVLAAMGKGATTPLAAVDRGASAAGPGSPMGTLTSLPPTGLAAPPVTGHLTYVWQPVRDACDSEAVLFYEMCPQMVGADGVRRDLAEARPALERLGRVAALDRHLAEHAVDVLTASPDLAVGVQISAQSVSSSAGWQGLFQRLTGDRSVANRLAVSITETSTFPDFGGAIRFVSRLQALGCAVGIDNFGLGYPVVFALFSSIFLAKGAGRAHLVPYFIVGTVIFIDVFCAVSAIATGGDVFALVTRNLVLFTSPVAIANSVVFRPKLALAANMTILTCLGFAAGSAMLDGNRTSIDLHLVARIVGVIGFFLWFSLAQFIAFRLYLKHRRELVEVHHLVAEMERNQRLSEENARIREDLLRTQRVQMVDSMTSTMAHEVNQPISCANNFIQAARRWLARPDPDIPEALESLGGAQDEIIRVSERVTAVRRLMQRLSSEFTSIDLRDLVSQAGGLVRRDFAKQDIRLVVEVEDDDEDYLIFGCEEELIQVLMNLTANAADALTKQDQPRRIAIGLREVDLGEVEIVVSDNGCGVSPEDIGRVFERLYTTKPGGSGLGLPLCRRIVTNHGGTIAMESEQGNGTRVVMRFPRAEGRRHAWGAP